jgi:hypothetical protein
VAVGNQPDKSKDILYIVSISMRVYFDNDFVNIEYNTDYTFIVLKWKIAPCSDDFRQGLHTLLLAMQHFKTGKVVVDASQLGTLSSEDQEWSVTSWANKAVRAGYSHQATVVSKDIFSKIPKSERLTNIGILTFAVFESFEDAIRWMEQATQSYQ